MLSRVADSLYWMSRYVERAENTARLLDVNLQMMLDFRNQPETVVRRHWLPVLNSLEHEALFHRLYEEADGDSVVDFVTFDPQNPNSIACCLTRARENARAVREQISPELWEQLNTLYLFIRADATRELLRAEPYQFFQRVIQGSHLFLGITDATVPRGEGWDFMQIGHLIERADCTSRILDVKYHILLPSGEQVGGTVDTIQWLAVLRSCSALEAYCQRYFGQVAPWKVAEFLILNGSFPRTLRFCVQGLDAALHRISGLPADKFGCEAERRSGRLRGELDYTTISEIFQNGLHQYLDRFQSRLSGIGVATHQQYCQGGWPSQTPRASGLGQSQPGQSQTQGPGQGSPGAGQTQFQTV